MNIVVLDGYTLNPGDLSWASAEALGDVTVYDRTAPADVVSRSAGATVLLTNKTPLPADVLDQLPNLRYVGVLATGYNIVDVDAARRREVVVTNVPGYGTASVVQMTFALLLELTLHVQRHSDSVRSGDWANSPDFCYWNYPLIELAGKTLGIIGFGDIGRHVADVATAFSMNLIGHSRTRTRTSQAHRPNFRWADDVPDLLAHSDVVSVHCPLTPETKGLINQQNLGRMKPSAFLLNTSRGPIVVDQDLADALNAGVIAGAGIDVLSTEPPAPDNPLFTAKNCLITPHISWATQEARARLMTMATDNLSAFLAGKPRNVVNP